MISNIRDNINHYVDNFKHTHTHTYKERERERESEISTPIHPYRQTDTHTRGGVIMIDVYSKLIIHIRADESKYSDIRWSDDAMTYFNFTNDNIDFSQAEAEVVLENKGAIIVAKDTVSIYVSIKYMTCTAAAAAAAATVILILTLLPPPPPLLLLMIQPLPLLLVGVYVCFAKITNAWHKTNK